MTIMAYGQNQLDKDTYSILRLALDNNKLPNDLVIQVDSITALMTGKKFITVRTTEENKLTTIYDESMKDIKIHFWAGEDMFLHNVNYFLKPDSIEIKRDRINISYKTVRPYRDPKNSNSQCYSGQLSGQRINGQWILKKSKFKTIDCEYGLKNYDK